MTQQSVRPADSSKPCCTENTVRRVQYRYYPEALSLSRTLGIFRTQSLLTFVDWLKIVLFCISIIDLETGTENCLYGAVV